MSVHNEILKADSDTKQISTATKKGKSHSKHHECYRRWQGDVRWPLEEVLQGSEERNFGMCEV